MVLERILRLPNYLYKGNQNFNDDLDSEKFYYVVEHNDLITKASHDLTARELKVTKGFLC